jgi:hypothetical protein
MSLLGAVRKFFSYFPDLIAEHRWDAAVGEVMRTGLLTGEIDHDHVLRLYRWRELHELLERHPCRIVAASAANFLVIGNEGAFAEDQRWLEVEIAACREPGRSTAELTSSLSSSGPEPNGGGARKLRVEIFCPNDGVFSPRNT